MFPFSKNKFRCEKGGERQREGDRERERARERKREREREREREQKSWILVLLWCIVQFSAERTLTHFDFEIKTTRFSCM